MYLKLQNSGRNKDKLAGRIFLLFWENDRVAIAIIKGLGDTATRQRIQGRALAGFGAKLRKMFAIFVVFLHEMC